MFLIKALIEFLDGKNIILLLQENQLIRKNIYKNYFRNIIEKKNIGEIKFIKEGK